jgi:K(+)-stimulated pyrophosphate-energized sodium pump
MDLVWICIIAGLVAAGVVAFFVRYVLKQDQGSEKLKEISAAIKEGGLAFIHREYRFCLRRHMFHGRRLCRHEHGAQV